MKTYKSKNNGQSELCSIIKELGRFSRAINKISLTDRIETIAKIRDLVDQELRELCEYGEEESPEVVEYSSVEDLVNKVL